MSTFARRFSCKDLARLSGSSKLVKRLLQEWQLPGLDAEPTQLGLRLCVRNGYVNFYVKGQSLARLQIARGSACVEVHNAYLGNGRSVGYTSFREEALLELSSSRLDDWHAAALQHAGEEKRFVDDLVSANAGTLDLEMALPGDPRVTKLIREQERKIAPRMDLVVVQDAGTSEPKLAFWEAKCADNGELRASGSNAPHVIGQIKKYVAWLQLPQEDHPRHGSLPDRAMEVVAAYQEAAQIMVELASSATKKPCQALTIWASAGSSHLVAVRQPAIVIGNYLPSVKGEHVSKAEKFARCASTFVGNGHQEKLEKTQIDQPLRVVQYAAPPVDPLPKLNGTIVGRAASV